MELFVVITILNCYNRNVAAHLYSGCGLASFKGEGMVDDEIVCKANFNLILPSELEKYNLKQK